ncbi:MAG TPA: hypothetical protein VHX38_13235 [Pseudonocardiaceae bacterium]|nr:hypothetical protein [Pseudonocardiaceae bacterium]
MRVSHGHLQSRHTKHLSFPVQAAWWQGFRLNVSRPAEPDSTNDAPPGRDRVLAIFDLVLRWIAEQGYHRCTVLNTVIDTRVEQAATIATTKKECGTASRPSRTPRCSVIQYSVVQS